MKKLLGHHFCIVFVSFFILFHYGTAQSDIGFATTSVYYSGDTPVCNSTICGESSYMSDIKCTSTEEPSLMKYFQDPVPKGYIATSITTTLFGMFGCNDVSSSFVVTVDKGAVGSSTSIPPESPDCSCNNCGVNVTLSAVPEENGWPGYKYGDQNTINIVIQGDSNICVSVAYLNITYRKSHPQFKNATPTLSPIQTESPVKITGSDFLPTNELSCNFGGNIVGAIYFDYNHITCAAPSLTMPQTVPLSIIADSNTTLSAGNYTFYIQPSIDYLYPTSANSTGGIDVYLYGSNFYDSGEIVCRFGRNIPVRAIYHNKTVVQCVNPIDFQSTTTKIVNVSFSENRIQYVDANQTFTFIGVLPSASASPSFTPTITPSASGSPRPSSIILPPDSQSENDTSLPRYIIAALGVLLLMIIILLIGCLIAAVRSLRGRRRIYSVDETSSLAINSSSYSVNSYFSDRSQEDGLMTIVDPNAIPHYELTNWKQIEKGSFGVIFEASWRGTRIAVKKLPPNLNQKLLKEFIQEAALMRSLRHPNILQYLGVSHSGNEISICMEFMELGSLYRLLHSNSQFSRDKIKSICLDTAKGMNYLHQRYPPIIHRDLKSHNLLVDSNWRVKVCDFGLSKLIVKSNATMTACGTPSWTAPEVLRNERYTTKADVYSFGIVIWEMFSRADPFPGLPPFQIVFAVGNQGLRPRLNDSWPEDWVKLITDCWSEDPSLRPTFEQIISQLAQLDTPTSLD